MTVLAIGEKKPPGLFTGRFSDDEFQCSSCACRERDSAQRGLNRQEGTLTVHDHSQTMKPGR